MGNTKKPMRIASFKLPEDLDRTSAHGRVRRVSEILRIPFELGSEAQRVQILLDRYASVPMSLADASLVRMAELDPHARIITLDSDFQIYRRDARHPLKLIFPA